MRYYFTPIAFLAVSLGNATSASAHFGLGGDEDVGHILFWVWGIFLVGIAGFFIYQRWFVSDEPPEGHALKGRLSELERALLSCQSQLQNAQDYPKECGLSELERQERQDSVISIKGMIDKTKSELAAI
jgi:hypothetical protein